MSLEHGTAVVLSSAGRAQHTTFLAQPAKSSFGGHEVASFSRNMGFGIIPHVLVAAQSRLLR